MFNELNQIGEDDVLLTYLPQILDFTKKTTVTLVIQTKNVKIDLTLPEKESELRVMGGKLHHYLGGKRIIIGWNAKNIYSYFLGKLQNCSFGLESQLYDLLVLEAYFDIEGEQPKTFIEARERLGKIIKHSCWKDLKNLYSRIYNPLLTKVIPEIETSGVVHQRQRKKVHPYYDITGQRHGRMSCRSKYEFGFNPHSINSLERPAIRPPFFDHVFMSLDYKNMEVAMLQWLSKDKVLGEILDSKVDAYEGIWTHLTGFFEEEYRQKCKDMFLPVIYGMGTESLSGMLKIKISLAERLISAIKNKFSIASEWITGQQNLFSLDGVAKDVFSRICLFSEKYYKIRNFVVQSPAALFCLDKLVTLKEDLKDNAKIVMHIHDAYFLSVHRTEVERVRHLASKSLEKESDLFQGLKLKVSCKIGLNMENMTYE